MELSSGYIWGLCDSWIPFAPYSSRHHVSVSAASGKIEKAADEESNLRQPPLELHCLQNRSTVFATADHEKKRLLQADINTISQLFIVLQKIQCRRLLHLFNTT